TLDIDADMPARPLPAASVDAVRAGRPLETTLPDGRRVSFRLPTQASAERALRRLRPDRGPARLLTTRVVAVDGVEGPELERLLLGLGETTAAELLERMDEADGGIVTRTEFSCARCGRTEARQLPLP